MLNKERNRITQPCVFRQATPTQFNAALERIERGLATVEDADLIRRYVAEMEEVINYYASCLADAREQLRLERASSDRFQRALNEALNSGSGAYIP